MICPHCNRKLQKLFYHRLLYFHCPECRGRLMTIAGLRNLCADKSFVDLLWKTARYGYAEPGPVCRSCGNTMKRTALPLGGIGLELDVCCFCQTVWFDPSELERIPLPGPGPDEELPQEKKERLALLQIQKEKERIENLYRLPGDARHTPEDGWKHLAGLLGLPVELDAPEIRKIPWLTWGIALICLLIFILTCRNLNQVIREWGFVPNEWNRKGGATLLSSMFLHGGVLHLIGNLYFLLLFGDNVEDETGKTDYLMLILFSGLSALGLHALLHPHSSVPCIGASGFISGIIACYAICFPKVRLSFRLSRLGDPIILRPNWFSIPAWAAFLLWLGWQVFMACFFRNADGGGVAWLAHIGGVIPGVILAFRIRVCRNRIRTEP